MIITTKGAHALSYAGHISKRLTVQLRDAERTLAAWAIQWRDED